MNQEPQSDELFALVHYHSNQVLLFVVNFDVKTIAGYVLRCNK